MISRRLALVSVIAAGALMATSCGGSDEAGRAATQGVGAGVGAPIKLATCEDWNRADPKQRRATVGSIRSFAGGQVTGKNVRGQGSVLSDDRAHRLFDNACGQKLARNFLLYKLYTHTAGFVGRAP